MGLTNSYLADGGAAFLIPTERTAGQRLYGRGCKLGVVVIARQRAVTSYAAIT